MSRRKNRQGVSVETDDAEPTVPKTMTVEDYARAGFEVRAKNRDRFQLATDVARFVRDTSGIEGYLTMFVKDENDNTVFIVKRRS